MAKKEYPPWHYLAAGALACLLGATYTFTTFNLLLGPGLLVLGIVFLVVGVRKHLKKRSAAAAAETPPS